ncbi:MAG TPA: hypothetical protein VFW33_19540 [Gemmataceae bacterium]|nr:hypothetical protein [Gemmataceae bacterium]
MDAIDDDTCAAVVALWKTDQADLPKLFAHPPRTGRLKAPDPYPSAQVDSEYARHESGFGYRKDVRKVTLTLRGVRADVVAGLKAALALFNRNMGGPSQAGLTYPSGARFIKWWPLDSGTMKQEDTTKEGLDVWAGILTAEVTSVRSP